MKLSDETVHDILWISRHSGMVDLLAIPPEQWNHKLPAHSLIWMAEASIKTKSGEWLRAKAFHPKPEKAVAKAVRQLVQKKSQKPVKKKKG